MDAYSPSSILVSDDMEAETKLHDCESGHKIVTIIANCGPERSSSFDRDEPSMCSASTVRCGAEPRKLNVGIKSGFVQRLWVLLC